MTRIIVHADAYEPADWRDVESRIGQFSDWLTLEHTEGVNRSYALRRPEGR